MKKITKLMSATILMSLLIEPISVLALTKNETVYTTLNAYGEENKISITNHLMNVEKQTEDQTFLQDILNINGEETYTLDGEKLLWSGNGKDIFYRGSFHQDLPINVNIEYFLNGEKQEVKDMIGKEGKVTIALSFKNTSRKNVKVNGKTTTLYTPFVVTLGTILNNGDNTNIEINNGKVVDTGTRNVVLGIASPGMYDNFQIQEFKSLDQITLSYETKKFTMSDMYMVATPKLLEDVDLDIFDKVGSLEKSINALESGMNELESGAKQLQDGSMGVAAGSKEISKNLQTALNAMKELEAGSIRLEEGLMTLRTELKKASGSLNNDTTGTSLAKLQELKTKNTVAKESLVRKTGMDITTLMNYYTQNLKEYTGDDATLLFLKSSCELIMLLDANNQALDTVLNTLGGIDSQIKVVLTTVDNALQELENGEKELSNGLYKLKNGLSILYSGSETLSKGASSLADGTKTLTTGIEKINKEGISLLSKGAKSGIGMSNKVKALTKLSKDYKGFSSNNANNTTFVYVIKKEK